MDLERFKEVLLYIYFIYKYIYIIYIIYFGATGQRDGEGIEAMKPNASRWPPESGAATGMGNSTFT